jgi:predicted amidophosphoribosyltransferase
MNSVCPQCQKQNPWEKLYCIHCGACLKGAELVERESPSRLKGRLRPTGLWLFLLVALVLLSLSGVAALLGGFLL